MTTVTNDRVLVDGAAAAARVGVTSGTLAKWRLTGRGPLFIKCGRAVRYDVADLNAWLDGRRRRSTADPGPNSVA